MGDLREELTNWLQRAANAEGVPYSLTPAGACQILDMLKVDENTSDGFHTFRELYDHREALTAAFFRALLTMDASWHRGPAPFNAHKSWRHSDGELCFGGGWFIVVATVPEGQVSYHYPADQWDDFGIPEREIPETFDGHTPADVIARLRAYGRG